ncbi:unnamed protein product [Calypogeia fissa]
MASLNGGRRALANVASKARSAMQSFRNSSLASSSSSEAALGNAGHSCPASSSTNFSTSTLLGNRRLSSQFLRVPKEVACMQSLLPLYSVTASSRLVSLLSTTAGAIPANLHDLSSLKPR